MIEPVALPQDLLDSIDTYAAVAEDDDKGVAARKVVIEKLRQFRAIPPGYAIVPVEQVKDAERYAWLRKGSPRSNRLPHITQYPYQAKIDENRIPQVWDIEGYHPERLDAAIDAAMLTAAKGE